MREKVGFCGPPLALCVAASQPTTIMSTFIGEELWTGEGEGAGNIDYSF